ncbi:MAG: aminopeptidase P family protein, partial [Prevotella sp.]|nr:aminopeptidase P family protein [Prevotella sp.]
KYCGESCASKLARIREELKNRHVCGMIVGALDDIAWTLNLRGKDVHCNPVFVSYLLIGKTKATLYINKVKVTDEVMAYLKAEGVEVKDYADVVGALRYFSDYNILVDPNEINHVLYSAIRCVKVEAPSPIPYMKAVKNEAEIDGFRNAMVRDGVAMVKFLYWLKSSADVALRSELSVSEHLEKLRSRYDEFRGLSFDTIAAYGEHGAIVHYEPTRESNAKLRQEGLLLLDSGAQYLDGTTDITRTIALGELTEEQKRVYTLVLKGHIKLQMLKFPYGASGTQLDAVARMDMWGEGMNFMHGTGHGVGAYLNVHEGPHQIRMEYRPAPLVPGMVVTDEPGLYLAGRFGVRIENMLLVVPYKSTEFGEFLQFDTLTLCPIDKEPIIVEMLSNDERQWLNDYHAKVRTALARHLTFDEREWLDKVTEPLK